MGAGQGRVIVKLPVFSVIGQTFAFVVERKFFTLLRLVWFPAVLSMLSSLMQPIYLYAAYGQLPDMPGEGGSVRINYGFEVNFTGDPVLDTLDIVDAFLQLVLGAIIAVSVHRIILRDEEDAGEYFHLRFTSDEFRYVLAGIGYMLLFILALFLPFMGHMYWMESRSGTLPFDWHQLIATEHLQTLAKSRAIFPLAGLSVLIGLGALARFGLVFPLIVAENRISFWRSWVLTRGNFLRLVAFWILMTVFATLLLGMLATVVFLAFNAVMGAITSGGATTGALALLVFAAPAGAAFLTYLVMGVTLFVAAMSFSYKALSTDEEEADSMSMAADAMDVTDDLIDLVDHAT